MQFPCDPEEVLLGEDPYTGLASPPQHACRTAPIITGDAMAALAHTVPQRAVYGRVIAQKANGFPMHAESSKLYINTNAPFSAVVCGVQGSGKSHSTAVLLESCLIQDERLGTLPQPLSALVFHFDTAAGGGLCQPCEAAYLASLDAVRGGNATPPSVKVLTLPGNLAAMSKVYAGLPGVTVECLRFGPQDISGDRLLAMMKVDEGNQIPLYMECIMNILRSMEGNFNYADFRDQLSKQKFSGTQKSMLNLRLSLLDSCLQGGSDTNKVSNHFVPGQLTIIDLSSPFMDASSACGFFDMILGLFIEADTGGTGKLVVLDEAHKYISDSGTSSRLTESLLSVIRQQRHLATRIVISTQEPTVVPTKFLDLCSLVIAHRFSSPKWLKLLSQHVSAAEDELFEKIVELGTGEAILFCPSGLGLRSPLIDPESGKSEPGTVRPFGQGYLHVRSRLRITVDGGQSLLAVRDDASATGFERERTQDVGLPSPVSAPSTIGSESPIPEAHIIESIAEATRQPEPPISASQQATEKTASPHASVKTAAPATSSVSASSSPPVAGSTSAQQFAPLVEYLQLHRGFLLSFKTARKHFRDNSPRLYGESVDQLNASFEEAARTGHVLMGGTGAHKWMKLPI